jgi:hypothetical protein
MRRGKQKEIKATIHRYLIRRNTKRQQIESTSARGKSGSATTTNMADDSVVTNAELQEIKSWALRTNWTKY